MNFTSIEMLFCEDTNVQAFIDLFAFPNCIKKLDVGYSDSLMPNFIRGVLQNSLHIEVLKIVDCDHIDPEKLEEYLEGLQTTCDVQIKSSDWG
jgi:hypothetical protein